MYSSLDVKSSSVISRFSVECLILLRLQSLDSSCRILKKNGSGESCDKFRKFMIDTSDIQIHSHTHAHTTSSKISPLLEISLQTQCVCNLSLFFYSICLSIQLQLQRCAGIVKHSVNIHTYCSWWIWRQSASPQRYWDTYGSSYIPFIRVIVFYCSVCRSFQRNSTISSSWKDLFTYSMGLMIPGVQEYALLNRKFLWSRPASPAKRRAKDNYEGFYIEKKPNPRIKMVALRFFDD